MLMHYPTRASLCIMVCASHTTPGLGACFVFLLGKLALHFSSDTELATMFLGCVVATVFFSKVVAKVALYGGRAVSRTRNHEGIPEGCRDPLSSKLQVCGNNHPGGRK